jgi:DNA-binding response OmpR family regulator
MRSILQIANEAVVAVGLQRTLRRYGFHVELAESGKTALDKIAKKRFDVILIDYDPSPKQTNRKTLQTPSSDSTCLDSTGVIRELRAAHVAAPILVYTVLEGEMYETAALDAGADDYITKRPPISILLSRLHAHIRRAERALGSSGGIKARFGLGRGMIDRASRTLAIDDVSVVLTTREVKLLEMLGADPSRVIPAEEVLEVVLGNDVHRSPRILASSLKRLRMKMRKHGLEDPVECVRGHGFRLSSAALQ